MKHYEITVSNGDYPLTYRCSTIAEAYGCLETLRTGLLHDREFDMDDVMELLVEMLHGKVLSHNCAGWSIGFCEGEG
ncbi:hypothetical protein RWV98_17755 [Agathobaculum sp. NTUH-O15-33]|uniref:hypothetical protein n=1 Tax=Agathobaculum sp. NTUH-O15-33 TaxID=3079302 RepID=UPI0029583C12|nr:hypothetical protein [Agathobaculum sp. NTUH-O15-33]WNX84396.1 hypothetical protein RWV98_17755 [Agathobaculum sp. NTUH-O15-33]